MKLTVSVLDKPVLLSGARPEHCAVRTQAKDPYPQHGTRTIAKRDCR